MNAIVFVILGIVVSIAVIILVRYLMDEVLYSDGTLSNFTTISLAIIFITIICCSTPKFTKLMKLSFEEVEQNYLQLQDKRENLEAEIELSKNQILVLQENPDKHNKKEIKNLQAEQKKLFFKSKITEKSLQKYEKRYNQLKLEIEQKRIKQEEKEQKKQKFQENKEKLVQFIIVHKILIIICVCFFITTIIGLKVLRKKVKQKKIQQEQYERKVIEVAQFLHRNNLILENSADYLQLESKIPSDYIEICKNSFEQVNEQIRNIKEFEKKVHMVAEYYYENNISVNDLDEILDYFNKISEFDTEIKKQEKIVKRNDDPSEKGQLTKLKNSREKFIEKKKKICSIYNNVPEEYFELYRNNSSEVNIELNNIITQAQLAYEKKLKEQIPVVASYLFTHNLPLEKIRESKRKVQVYEKEIKELEQSIKNAKNAYQNISKESGIFNFGKTDRLAEAEKTINAEYDRRDKYILNNKEKYDTSISLINSLPEYFLECIEKFEYQIQSEVQSLKEKSEQAKKEADNKKAEDEQKQKNIATAKILEDKNKKEESDKLSQLIEDLKSKIDDIENIIPVIQNSVSQTKPIDFQILKSLEDLLDPLEDNKENIPEDYINNLKRAQKKILDVFNRCSNKDDIQVDIDIINDSFEKILG